MKYIRLWGDGTVRYNPHSRHTSPAQVVIIYGFHPIKRWRYRHIPGPPTRWLVGGLPELGRQSMAPAYRTWAAQYAHHGVFKVFWGGIPHVIVTEPSLVRRVLTSTGQKYKQPFVRATDLDAQMLANNMLFMTTGKEWKERRNVWTPFFSQRRLESYLPGMLRSLGRLDGALDRAAAEGKVIDLWPVMGSLTLDVIATAAAGIPIETLTADMDDVKHLTPGASLAEKLAWSMRAVLNSVEVGGPMALLYIFPGCDMAAAAMARLAPSKVSRDRRRAVELLFSTYEQLVAACRAGEGGIDPHSFLAAAAAVRDKDTGELKKPMWAMMMIHLFLIAGYETTAAAIAFTVYFLSRNKDKEAAVLAEVDAFGRDRLPQSVAELDELPYLKAALEEALRLLPPGPVAMREAKADMQLGPYFVPAGTWMHAFVWDMHRSGEYWGPGAEEYRPERFLQEDGAGKYGSAFMPFGEGARRCPGYRLALQEGVLALLRMYQRFTFELEPGQVPLPVRSMVTMAPTRGVWARVLKRK